MDKNIKMRHMVPLVLENIDRHSFRRDENTIKGIFEALTNLIHEKTISHPVDFPDFSWYNSLQSGK